MPRPGDAIGFAGEAGSIGDERPDETVDMGAESMAGDGSSSPSMSLTARGQMLPQRERGPFSACSAAFSALSRW